VKAKFKKHFWQIAAAGYLAAIFVLSSIPGLTPPPLGFGWEDKFYHFLEYALLSFLLFMAFNASAGEFWRRKAHGLAILVGALYAATDEVHQHFVKNRQGDFWDWVADGAGVITVQVVMIVVRLLSRTNKTNLSPPLSS
jgi:VanZ family protein